MQELKITFDAVQREAQQTYENNPVYIFIPKSQWFIVSEDDKNIILRENTIMGVMKGEKK